MEKVFGNTHLDTLISIHCLADILQNRHEFEEASLLYQKACAGYKLSLGFEHPVTRACVDHYSTMLSSRRGKIHVIVHDSPAFHSYITVFLMYVIGTVLLERLFSFYL